MSLRDLAIRRLAIIRGETGDETAGETVKQSVSLFQLGTAEPAEVETHLRRKSADNDTCFTVSVPNAGNSETRLPGGVASGLDRLRKGPVPTAIAAPVWHEVVADAMRLAAEGWAAKALELGWGLVDLFGAMTDPGGDPAADGLAVRLAGREVLAISASFVTVSEGRCARVFLHRPIGEGARLLWELEGDE